VGVSDYDCPITKLERSNAGNQNVVPCAQQHGVNVELGPIDSNISLHVTTLINPPQSPQDLVAAFNDPNDIHIEVNLPKVVEESESSSNAHIELAHLEGDQAVDSPTKPVKLPVLEEPSRNESVLAALTTVQNEKRSTRFPRRGEPTRNESTSTAVSIIQSEIKLANFPVREASRNDSALTTMSIIQNDKRWDDKNETMNS